MRELSAEASRALPQVQAVGVSAREYDDAATPGAEGALGMIASYFRMECHDGQEGGTNFCPAGIESTADNAFTSSLIANIELARFKLDDVYAANPDERLACKLGRESGELGQGGAIYEPAGSDKFILASGRLLDCYFNEVGTVTYAKAEEGRQFAAVMTGREVPAPGLGTSSDIFQVYARRAEDTTELLALNMVLFNEGSGGEVVAWRLLLIANLRLHRYIVKQRVNNNNMLAIGTAGYDPDGNYFAGDSVARIVDPDNEINEPMTFCVSNGETLALNAMVEGCDELAQGYADVEAGAWDFVSGYLEMDESDQSALAGFAPLFDGGALLPETELPTSFTDGFPVSVSGQ